MERSWLWFVALPVAFLPARCKCAVCAVCSVQCDRCRQIWKGRGGVVLAVLVVLVELELLALSGLLGLLLVLVPVLMLLLVPRLLGAWFEWRSLFFLPLPGATTTKTRQRDHHLSLTATGCLMELPLHKLYGLQWMGQILFSMKNDRNHGIVSTRVNQQVWFVQYSPFPDTNSRIGEMLFATNMSCHQFLSFC